MWSLYGGLIKSPLFIDMRRIILLGLVFFSYICFSAEVPSPTYLLKLNGKVDGVVFYDSGKIETNNLVVGMTYQPKDAQRDYTTGTNSSIMFSLVDDVVLNVEENSEFKLHTSTVNVNDRISIPIKPSFTNKNHVASLMNGTVDIINLSSNGTFLLQTPRVSMSINKGKCRVIVQGKTTIVAVLDGNVVLHKLVENKSVLVDTGKYAHVTTYYSLIGKGIDLTNNGKATADVRLIELGDIKKMSDSFGETEKLHDSFIYIAEGGRILGVKIR